MLPLPLQQTSSPLPSLNHPEKSLPPVPSITGGDRYQDIRRLLPREVFGDAPLIVDGGAYKGEIADRFLALFPEATVYAFEPTPHRAVKLAAKYEAHPRVTVHPLALGREDGEAVLNITVGNTFTSLLHPTERLSAAHGERTRVVEQVRIPVVRLDSMFQAPPEILKLDVQGNERNVLEGAGALLPGIKVLNLEVAFEHLYAGEPLFHELEAFLTSCGFELHALYEPRMGAHGRIVSADAVFVNRSILPL